MSPNTDVVKRPRLFFAAGPGNVIEAHNNWRQGIEDPSQMSVTFSSEFENFCQDLGAQAYVISSGYPATTLSDGSFVIERMPKRAARGIWYHFNELLYGLRLLIAAGKFRADYAVIQSGSTHYFILSLFCIFSIKVIPVLHNTLWPAGFRPRSGVARAIGKLDAAFFRWFATSTIGVSPECVRQVKEVTNGQHGPIFEIMPQFDRRLFSLLPPPCRTIPFMVVYAGRITRDKGVFDLLDIMHRVEATLPGMVKLQICGDGPELHALRSECKLRQLDEIIDIKGRVEPILLRDILIESHVAIVPTRSDFAEGMAMTAIEPVLVGRPVITSPVVPALEVLREACIAAETDNIFSYAAAIVSLVQSPDLYNSLVTNCAGLREKFFDRSNSFYAALAKAII